jgi:penicillin-binding protein 1A
VGYDDTAVSLGKPETGAIAALPIWLEFMRGALAGKAIEAFQNVVPLEKQALTKQVKVDTPDSAPTEASEIPTSNKPPAGNNAKPPDVVPASKTPPETVPPPKQTPISTGDTLGSAASDH